MNQRSNMHEVRRIAAALRRGEKVRVSPELRERAEAHLRNRAKYNARRKRVRDTAARVRARNKVRPASDIAAAVQKHLAYREWYNADRVAKRAADRKKS